MKRFSRFLCSIVKGVGGALLFVLAIAAFGAAVMAAVWGVGIVATWLFDVRLTTKSANDTAMFGAFFLYTTVFAGFVLCALWNVGAWVWKCWRRSGNHQPLD
jgi:hypothetical protein